MTTYQVLYTTTASTVVTIEADSPEEAREIADDQFDGPTLCAQCSGWGGRQNLDIGDWEQDESDRGVWSA